jgi:hypothetical protein
MKLRDKYGWPVERIKGRPITNIIRLIIHTSIKQTLRARKKVYDDIMPGTPTVEAWTDASKSA